MRNARIFKSLRLLFLFFLIPALAFSQNISVNGVVKDIAGEPIIGVSVVESGTTNGTITDTDGKFSISLSPQGKLTFSFIGFVMQTINVSGRNRIDVILEEDNKMLEEVVVIGYGTQRTESRIV